MGEGGGGALIGISPRASKWLETALCINILLLSYLCSIRLNPCKDSRIPRAIESSCTR